MKKERFEMAEYPGAYLLRKQNRLTGCRIRKVALFVYQLMLRSACSPRISFH